MKKKGERGSMTVEAAFVFPIVFFVVVALCYFTFYMCDRTIIQGTVQELVEKESICVKEDTVLGKKRDYSKISEKGIFYILKDLSSQNTDLSKELTKQGKEKLNLGKITRVDTKVTHTEVEATITVETTIGVSQVKKYFTGTPLQYRVTVKTPVHNPAEFARGFKAVGETIDSVKGLKQLKNNLQDIKKAKKKS